MVDLDSLRKHYSDQFDELIEKSESQIKDLQERVNYNTKRKAGLLDVLYKVEKAITDRQDKIKSTKLGKKLTDYVEISIYVTDTKLIFLRLSYDYVAIFGVRDCKKKWDWQGNNDLKLESPHSLDVNLLDIVLTKTIDEVYEW